MLSVKLLPMNNVSYTNGNKSSVKLFNVVVNAISYVIVHEIFYHLEL